MPISVFTTERGDSENWNLYSINDQFNLIRGQEEAESDAQNVVINIKSINRMERTDRALDQVMRTAGITDE